VGSDWSCFGGAIFFLALAPPPSTALSAGTKGASNPLLAPNEHGPDLFLPDPLAPRSGPLFNVAEVRVAAPGNAGH
jgi:hypothetical protein